MDLIDGRWSDQENGWSVSGYCRMVENCLQIFPVYLQWDMLAGRTAFETGVVGTEENELVAIRMKMQNRMYR
jgi:hypothetical protein